MQTVKTQSLNSKWPPLVDSWHDNFEASLVIDVKTKAVSKSFVIMVTSILHFTGTSNLYMSGALN